MTQLSINNFISYNEETKSGKIAINILKCRFCICIFCRIESNVLLLFDDDFSLRWLARVHSNTRLIEMTSSAYGLRRIQFVYSNWHLNEWCWHVAEALDGCIWQIPTDAKPDILAMTHSPFRTFERHFSSRPRLIRTEHAMSMAIFYRDFLLRLNSNAQRQSHGYSRQCSRDQPTESRVQNNRITHKIRDTTLSQSHIRVKPNNR